MVDVIFYKESSYMIVYKKLLEQSFNEKHRDLMSSAIYQAYTSATVAGKEFGSFKEQAIPYLRWFFCDVMLEKAAKKSNLNHFIELNKSKNNKHLIIKSNNLSLSAHHIDNNQVLPRKAKYRASYASRNDDFFEDEINNFTASTNHVYLLHDGKYHLENLCLTIPDEQNTCAIYTEQLRLVTATLVDEEDINSDIRDKIKINTENILKQKIS